MRGAEFSMLGLIDLGYNISSWYTRENIRHYFSFRFIWISFEYLNRRKAASHATELSPESNECRPVLPQNHAVLRVTTKCTSRELAPLQETRGSCPKRKSSWVDPTRVEHDNTKNFTRIFHPKLPCCPFTTPEIPTVLFFSILDPRASQLDYVESRMLLFPPENDTW